MQKHWILIPFAAVATIVLTMLVYTFFFPRPVYEPVYVISELNGQVVLYEKGSTEPLFHYEIYTVLLPKTDVAALEDGIEVSDYASAQKILEDFGL